MQRSGRRWWLVVLAVVGVVPVTVLWAEGDAPAAAEGGRRAEAQNGGAGTVPEAVKPYLRQAQTERRRVDTAWVTLSFDPSIDDSTLVQLRRSFYQARLAQEQAFQQAAAGGDMTGLPNRLLAIRGTLDGLMRQAVPADTYRKLFGGEGGPAAETGDRPSPEAGAAPPTGPRDGEGTKPGPRDG